MASPAEVAGNQLGSTIVGGSTGWTLRVGNLIDIPDRQVVMYDTGGESPNPAWLVDFYTFQAIIRTSPNAYGEGWTKAKEVKDKLLGMNSQTISGDIWVSVICKGDIGFIGYDDKDRAQFSINFRAIIEPATNSITSREAL